MARAQWAAMMRRAPQPLTRGGLRDTLGPGDAEGADGRFSDFYAFASPRHGPLLGRRRLGRLRARPRRPPPRRRHRRRVDAAADGLARRGAGPARARPLRDRRHLARPGATGVYELTAGATAARRLPLRRRRRARRHARPGRAPLRVGRYERIYGIVATSDAPVVVSVVSPDFVPRVRSSARRARSRPRRGPSSASPATASRACSCATSPAGTRPTASSSRPSRPARAAPSPSRRGRCPRATLAPDGRGLSATLGDDSWLAGYRYVDTYRFAIRDGMRTLVRVTSDEVAARVSPHPHRPPRRARGGGRPQPARGPRGRHRAGAAGRRVRP